MNERENSMLNVMPLRSKDGYLSKIVTEYFTGELVNARKEKTTYDYKYALSLLSRGRKGNVHDVRAAFELFKEVGRYVPFYKDVANVMEEACSYGVVVTGIDFESAVGGVVNELIMKELNNLDPSGWNSC